MKITLFNSLFLILIFTYHYTNPISIGQPTDEDYQQTLAIIYNVGLNTYKSHFQQILSPEQVENISHSFESTMFQAMWNSRHDGNNYFFVAKDDNTVIGMLYASIEKDNFYNAVTDQSLILTINEVYILPAYQNKGIGKQLIC